MVSRRWSTRLFPTALVLLVACGATGQGGHGGGGHADDHSTPPLLVSVQPVGQATLATSLSYAGNIQARASMNVLPQTTGRLNRLAVDVGSSVKAGDLIAELDRAPLDAQVLQAAAALGNAQSRLNLLLAGARPESVEAARGAVAAAEQQLALMLAGGRRENSSEPQNNE